MQRAIELQVSEEFFKSIGVSVQERERDPTVGNMKNISVLAGNYPTAVPG